MLLRGFERFANSESLQAIDDVIAFPLSDNFTVDRASPTGPTLTGCFASNLFSGTAYA
jgi:hypothetical protein